MVHLEIHFCKGLFPYSGKKEIIWWNVFGAFWILKRIPFTHYIYFMYFCNILNRKQILNFTHVFYSKLKNKTNTKYSNI